MHFQLTKQAVHQHLERASQRELYYNELIAQSQAIRHRHFRMGAKIIYDILKPSHIGRDRFEQLLLSRGFRLRKIKNYFKTTDSGPTHYTNLIAGATLTDINQVWASDITYFIASDDTLYYIIAIMDLYSRRILGYAASLTLAADQTSMKALKMALRLRGLDRYEQLIHHSDPGSQYRYNPYVDLLTGYNIRISMCDNALDNSHQERLNGTIKNDYLDHFDTSSLGKLRYALNQTVYRYNHEKPHGSLSKMTPVAFEQFLLSTQNRPPMNIYQPQSTVNSQKKKVAKKKNLPSDNNNNNNNHTK